MDFKKLNEQAHDADNFLETLGKMLWKRKWLLLFLLFCYCVYWAFTQPVEQADEVYPTEQVAPSHDDGQYQEQDDASQDGDYYYEDDAE